MAKVLFVDDDMLTLQLMDTASMLLGHQAILCANGKTAMTVAKEQKPDLILIDLGLQDMDGLTLTKMLANQIDTSRIPILIVTAGHTLEDEQKSLQAGARGMLQKPLRLEVLKQAISDNANK
jgi:DNA-binding response OmpR family regulator